MEKQTVRFASSPDLYECPDCGEHVEPVETVACAEKIRFYSCPSSECDFSTWEPGEWKPVEA